MEGLVQTPQTPPAHGPGTGARRGMENMRGRNMMSMEVSEGWYHSSRAVARYFVNGVGDCI